MLIFAKCVPWMALVRNAAVGPVHMVKKGTQICDLLANKCPEGHDSVSKTRGIYLTRGLLFDSEGHLFDMECHLFDRERHLFDWKVQLF